jgi:hypothetical protein
VSRRTQVCQGSHSLLGLRCGAPFVPQPGQAVCEECARFMRPAGLDSYGVVLTEAELCAVLGMRPRWPEVQRRKAKALGVAPNLPPEMDGIRPRRYRKADVQRWIDIGSRARGALRRVS